MKSILTKPLTEILREGQEDKVFFDNIYPRVKNQHNWNSMEGVKDTPDDGAKGNKFRIKKKDPRKYLYRNKYPKLTT